MYRRKHTQERTSLWCPECHKWINEYNILLNDSICTCCDKLNLVDLYEKGKIEKLVELVDSRTGDVFKTFRTTYLKEKQMFEFSKLDEAFNKMDETFNKMGETFNKLDNVFYNFNNNKLNNIGIFYNGKNITEEVMNVIREKYKNVDETKVNKDNKNPTNITKEKPKEDKKEPNLDVVKNFVKKTIIHFCDDVTSCFEVEPVEMVALIETFNKNEKFLTYLFNMSQQDAYYEILKKFHIFVALKKHLIKGIKFETPFEIMASYKVDKILQFNEFKYRLKLADNPECFIEIDLINNKLDMNKNFEILVRKENTTEKEWNTFQNKLSKLFFDIFVEKEQRKASDKK